MALSTLIFSFSAFLSAAAAIATFITGLLFFSQGDRFGKLNDISSIFQVLLSIPLAVGLSILSPIPLGWLFAALGISGMLISAYGQSRLVLERIDFEESAKFFPAGGAIGLWLIGINILALTSAQLPTALAWFGILAGVGYIATVIGFLKGGQGDPLFYIGGGLLALSYPTWAIWLGLLFRNSLSVM